MKVHPPLQRDVVLKVFVSACRVKNGCRQNLLDNYFRGQRSLDDGDDDDGADKKTAGKYS